MMFLFLVIAALVLSFASLAMSLVTQRRLRSLRRRIQALGQSTQETKPARTSTGGFVMNEHVRAKANGIEGRVTAPWYRGGVWVDNLGPYDPNDLERI
jgi:hypothetical protein